MALRPLIRTQRPIQRMAPAGAMTLAGTQRQQCRERLLFMSGEFHCSDADVMGWTLHERRLMLEERDELVKEWKQHVPRSPAKKGKYGKHR